MAKPANVTCASCNGDQLHIRHFMGHTDQGCQPPRCLALLVYSLINQDRSSQCNIPVDMQYFY
eukprot:1162108-Pelagomonas_calceolata.AAC.4